MNDSSAVTSAPGSSLIPDTTGAFTIAHLAVIAIFALLVVVAIVWGVRLKRARTVADRQLHQHNREVQERTGDAGPAAETVTTQPAPATSPAATPVIAPAARTEPADPLVGDRSPEPMAPEPVAAAAPLEASPAGEALSAPTPPAIVAVAGADAPTTQLKGLGPKVAARLAELGITTVGQIAALDDGEAADLDARLGAFSGRMMRDRWIEQARFLAAGDRTGFEAVFGKL